MRAPIFRAAFDGELVIDNFAGGGGASTGIAEAIGRSPDIAINHDPEAIAMHTINHPETRHYCESIWDVDPVEACAGRPVGLAWFSPDCKHFSRAKGTKPLDKNIRGLAWVAVNWARAVRPRVICLENVEEFETWGPLDANDRPIPERAGETFREWLAALTTLGYSVEFRSLIAADFGAPTTRRRLFLVARLDGRPAWPAATHGPGRGARWRPASEVIDWSIPCSSIFNRKKPLAEATLRRIAVGIQRYVINAAEPFIVPVTHQGPRAPHPIDEPMRTVTAAHRGELALVAPLVIRHGHYSTISGAGLREGCGAGTFRGQQLGFPLATVCATNDKHLVCPILTKHYGGPNGHPVVGHDVRSTMGTVTARDHHALTAAFLTKFQQNSAGQALGDPIHTVMAGATRFAEVRAFLIKFYGTSTAQDAQLPIPTITTGGGRGGGHIGVVMVRGEPYRIVDIGMRMLEPHELYRAQGFPANYEIAPIVNGKRLSKTAQIRMAGNSVCPPVARAVVAAQIAAR
jgi:DNA (cytosine-5)-methyltransferase 1